MVGWVWLAAGCSGGAELDGVSPTTGGSDTVPTDTAAPPPRDCPWVGAWDLVSVECGGFPHASWLEEHDSAVLDIAHEPAGTGCSVAATVSGPTCTRTEDWHLSRPVGTSVGATFEGVTACDPEACVFGATDAVECRPGGGGSAEIVHLELVAPDRMRISDLLRASAPGCPLEVVTEWGLR